MPFLKFKDRWMCVCIAQVGGRRWGVTWFKNKAVTRHEVKSLNFKLVNLLHVAPPRSRLFVFVGTFAVCVNGLKRPECRSETLRLVPLGRFVVSCIPTWFWGPMVTLEDCLAAFFAADELKGLKNHDGNMAPLCHRSAEALLRH